MRSDLHRQQVGSKSESHSASRDTSDATSPRLWRATSFANLGVRNPEKEMCVELESLSSLQE